DSHSCTTESRPGFHYDGKLILTEESRPGQIPYRSLLPQGVDNLLVPVCLSATHIAWGAVRLEPVWMQTGEAAGVAAALALKRRTPPAQLEPDQLVRELCERRFMVSFFNDVSVAWNEPWVAAAQYLGTKGFFHDYNARMGEPLKQATGKVWAEGLARLLKGQLDPNALARAVAEAEQSEKPMTASEFAALLSPSPQAADPPRRTGDFSYARPPGITRGEAVRLLWERLSQK
ncbi:MAG: FAD-dependent oxidoreductase, partial [Planctomycetes bacterium]|nr:FAD-dependent oxidoreductase [Planctomycetota bacterium]